MSRETDTLVFCICERGLDVDSYVSCMGSLSVSIDDTDLQDDLSLMSRGSLHAARRVLVDDRAHKNVIRLPIIILILPVNQLQWTYVSQMAYEEDSEARPWHQWNHGLLHKPISKVSKQVPGRQLIEVTFFVT